MAIGLGSSWPFLARLPFNSGGKLGELRGNFSTFAKIGALIGALLLIRALVRAAYKQLRHAHSPAAKSFLDRARPFPPVTDPSQWPLIRAGFTAATTAVSEQAQRKYIQEFHEINLDGVSVLVATPKGCREAQTLLVYIPGGAWILGEPSHLYHMFAPLAFQISCPAYVINYRKAPEHPFPAGLQDCFRVYKALLAAHEAGRILLFGDSAGGNLLIAMMVQARDERLALPRAIALLSPVATLDRTRDDPALAALDPKLSPANLTAAAKAYAGAIDVRDPRLSVINADFTKGFPKVMIVVGSREILLSDAKALHNKLVGAGQQSYLRINQGLWHNPQEEDVSEAEAMVKPIAQFLRSHIL